MADNIHRPRTLNNPGVGKAHPKPAPAPQKDKLPVVKIPTQCTEHLKVPVSNYNRGRTN